MVMMEPQQSILLDDNHDQHKFSGMKRKRANSDDHCSIKSLFDIKSCCSKIVRMGIKLLWLMPACLKTFCLREMTACFRKIKLAL